MSGEQLYHRLQKKNRGHIFLLSFLSVCISILTVGFAYLSKWVLDSIGTPQFVIFASILGTIILFEVLGKMLSNHLSSKFSYRLECQLREEVYFSYLRKPQMECEEKKDSEWVSRLISDVRVVSSGVIGYIPSVVSLLSRICLSFVILFVVDWLFALILFCAGILIYVSTYFLRKRNKVLHKNVQEKEANNLGFYQEGVSHSFLFRLFSQWSNLSKKCEKIQEEVYAAKMKQMVFSNFINGGFLFFMRASYFLSIIYCALRFDAGLSVGSLFAMVQLIGQIEGPFSSLSGMIPRYYSTIGSCERIIECYQMEADEKEHLSSFDYVEFRNVSFSYHEEDWILKNVNLTMERGKFYVLMGPSGGGKSTLTKLLMGLYCPTNGVIKTMGKDMTSLEGLFSYVPQGNWLLQGTIRENLTLFQEHATEEDCYQALDLACLKEKVLSLPKKLDTPLSDFGEGLSVGEGQRLSIARALITKRPFLVLDECTSALDEESEKQLLQKLKSQNSTILFISHKPRAKEYADKVWVLKEGVVVEND